MWCKSTGAHRLHSLLSVLRCQVARPLDASAIEDQLLGSIYIPCRHHGKLRPLSRQAQADASTVSPQQHHRYTWSRNDRRGLTGAQRMYARVYDGTLGSHV